jgi:predicted ribonuclease YlaK
VLRIIEQNKNTPYASTQEAILIVREEVDKQIGLLNNLYGASFGGTIYVPDTNALLFNPQLENWRFSESPKFVLVLTPTVLKELDELKVSHRNETVREKSEKLISRIKGYRARGRITEGVPLVKGISEILALAVEPNVTNSLPWLDAQNSDDRILVSTLEVMRQRPRSTVILVTRDINLQNKAEFARIPFAEPPANPTP